MPRDDMHGSRKALTVVGALALVVGLAAGGGGSVAVFAHAAGRDASGFFTTPAVRLDTPTFALTSTEIDLGWSRASGAGRRATTRR